jgi:hypothetical protein
MRLSHRVIDFCFTSHVVSESAIHRCLRVLPIGCTQHLAQMLRVLHLNVDVRFQEGGSQAAEGEAQR